MSYTELGYTGVITQAYLLTYDDDNWTWNVEDLGRRRSLYEYWLSRYAGSGLVLVAERGLFADTHSCYTYLHCPSEIYYSMAGNKRMWLVERAMLRPMIAHVDNPRRRITQQQRNRDRSVLDWFSGLLAALIGAEDLVRSDRPLFEAAVIVDDLVRPAWHGQVL